jgi:hypothetical protein
MKKEATQKYKGLKGNTSDKKRGIPKVQRVQKRGHLMKKEAISQTKN